MIGLSFYLTYGFSSERHDVIHVRVVLQRINLGDGVVSHADDLLHSKLRVPGHACKLGWFDELCIVVRAFWQQIQHVFGAYHREKYDFGLRLMVEKNTQPPGLARVAHALTVLAGSGTCSSISMQVTTS